MQAVDKDYHPELLEIINETYTDRLERILVAEIDDDGTIKAIGQDGQKQIGVILSEDAIQIKELKRGTSTINFAGAKKCVKGLSCGGTCISRGSLCRKALTPKQAAKVAELRKRISKGDTKAKESLDKFKKQRVDMADAKTKREVMRMVGITKAQDEAIGPKKDKPKAAEAPVKGGALVAPAGKLATVPKKEEPRTEAPQAKGVNNTIDEKYASENPSQSDIDNWVKERIEARTNPTDENVAQRVAEKIAWHVSLDHLEGIGQPTPAGQAFRDRAVDRESFAKAMVAADDLTMSLHPGKYTRSLEEIEANWRDSLSAKNSDYFLKEKDLASVNRTIANPKASEKTRKAAMGKLDRHNKAIATADEQMLRVPELTRRTFEQYQGTPEQRLQVHLDRFDREVEGAKKDMAKEREMLKTPRGRQQVVDSIPTGHVLADDGERRPRTPKEYLKFVAENPPTVNDQRTKAQVKADYRRDAAKYHPDNKDTGDVERFRKIQSAYERKMQDFD